MDTLRGSLSGLDGKDYARYQSLRGEHDFGTHSLVVDQVPKDPYDASRHRRLPGTRGLPMHSS